MTSSVEVSIQAVSPESTLGAGAAAGAASAGAGAAAGAAAAAGVSAAGAAADAGSAAGCWARAMDPPTNMPRPRTKEANSFFMDDVLSDAPRASKRVLARLAGADADDLLDVVHEDLAVADLAGARRAFDRFDHALDQVVGHGGLDLDLGQEVDHVLRAAVQLGVALLAAEALDFGDGDALHADGRQGLAHLIELERFDDR